MELYISLLALVATFYQLHLQRVHNEKSLQPFVQVDLRDRSKSITVHLCNNGVGPFIVKSLTFLKDGHIYNHIEDSLQIDPRTYFSIAITPDSEKVILPAGHLEVFSAQYDSNEPIETINDIRQQIASLTVKAQGRDIYNNDITIERNLQWFLKNIQSPGSSKAEVI